MRQENVLLAALLGSLVFIALVAILGGFLHYRRERMLAHKERMKALELGREMPDDAATAQIRAAFGATGSGGDSEENESLPRKCFTTALWVAFWGFLFAGQTATHGGSASMAVSIAIAVSVAAIGVTAMICGTILASRTPAQVKVAKPAIGTDAFDVVSSRG